MGTNPEASSPAVNGDGSGNDGGSGNLSTAQAAAKLFAAASTAAEATQQKPSADATEENAPEKSEETQDPPVAEAPAASVEAQLTSIDDADDDLPAEPKEKVEPDPEVLSQQTFQLPKEAQEILNRRIAKEVAKSKTLRETLEAKVQAAEKRAADSEAKASTPALAPAPQPTPITPGIPADHPAAKANDMQSLNALQKQAKMALRWAEETLDSPKAWKTRIDTDPDTGEETAVRVTPIGDEQYTEAQIKGLMRNARLSIEDHIPARAQFLNARQQAMQMAQQRHPFLSDKQSPDYQRAQAILQDPWMQQRTDAEWLAGVLVRGMKDLEREEAGKADSKSKVRAPAQKPGSDQTASPSVTGTARVPVHTGNRQALASEEAKLRTKGGITTAEAIASLQNRERFRNSR